MRTLALRSSTMSFRNALSMDGVEVLRACGKRWYKSSQPKRSTTAFTLPPFWVERVSITIWPGRSEGANTRPS